MVGIQWWEFCLSVCLSVRPSVCPSIKRVHCDKTEEKSVHFYTVRKIIYRCFLRRKMVAGGRPLLPKFWVNRPPLERNRRFWIDNRSYSALAVTPSEKSSINTNRKSSDALSNEPITRYLCRPLSSLPHLWDKFCAAAAASTQRLSHVFTPLPPPAPLPAADKSPRSTWWPWLSHTHRAVAAAVCYRVNAFRFCVFPLSKSSSKR